MAAQLSLSASLHVVAASTLLLLAGHLAMTPITTTPVSTVATKVEVRHIVFIAPHNPNPGGGGGGGGNRQTGPIRRAEAPGTDKVTLRIAKPVAPARAVANVPAVAPELPAVLLDAKPLASGSVEHPGLPGAGVTFGMSTGPGSGGGVGEGVGTGIGPGRGPGIGSGSGGGIGGGVYRPGGSVTAPRVIVEVKPTYTGDALIRKIQGTVVLELIVRANGLPSDIRVIRSLDPGGLDEQAVVAAGQWRFEPGRLAGTPVDVVVTVMLDFWIR